MTGSFTKPHLHQRLLRDIDELCRKPYPNIALHVHDDDLTQLCLVLSPPGWGDMHLTISNLSSYPIAPPRVRMDSAVIHPNVFGGYICASILNNHAGYTPAYTLKSIAIQLLSFFSSDNIEQEHGGRPVNLDNFRQGLQEWQAEIHDSYKCAKCKFCMARVKQIKKDVPGAVYVTTTPQKRRRRGQKGTDSTGSSSTKSGTGTPGSSGNSIHNFTAEYDDTTMHIDKVPNEILLLILKKVEDFEDLTNFARAWSKVSRVITDFDVLRQRELQCFVLKKTYHEVNLGVGVSGDVKEISSEFDLLSQEAYSDLQVRTSVHNVVFDRWLPLPVSRPHWNRVRQTAHNTLEGLKKLGCIKYTQPTNVQVLYQFMTDIIVRLNRVEVDRREDRTSKSTLTHASDKAIEAYFHLFHLLLCLATEDDSVVRAANRLLTRFQEGKCSKTDAPNLGHLLIAMLISDVKVTPEIRKAIVTEAITRNVVWTLKDNPQLAYKEPDNVSAYRLDRTFQASRTSYRLLMFSELFRRTARPDHKPLVDIREELFNRHGGPPPGAASQVAAEVRRLHGVSDFTHFMREMGFEAVPTAANFTRFLRRTLDDSVRAGYSQEPLSQAQALALRLPYDGAVGIRHELRATFNSWRRADGVLVLPRVPAGRIRFFPEKQGNGGNGSSHNGGRGGRGGRDGRR
ncbi:NEDD8-conjugating enzyme UBC12-like protein 2 [Seiridium cupressi]